MVGILADGKIRIGMLCFSVFLYCSLPSYGAPPLQHPEQPAASDKKDSTPVSPSIKPPSVTPSAKDEKKKAPKEGVKQAHSGPPNGTIPAKPKHSMSQPHNPIDMSTGQELLPMPDEPKR